MSISELLKEKQNIAKNIKKKYKLPVKYKALGIIYIKNEILLDKLSE
jgi:hypothetical protein